MEDIQSVVTIKELYSLDQTMAKPLLEKLTYPWEALPLIKDFVLELGKSLDKLTSIGPCIVTKDEIGNVADLGIRSYVNGELRQNSNTGFMIQTIGGAVEELSEGMTLLAGTLIATGTPAGVGMGFNPPKFLKTGDKVICEIDKIGRLENTIGE